MELTAKNVYDVLLECLFRPGEDQSDFVPADGVRLHLGFHPERLKRNEDNIVSMLDQLPADFKQSGGGGSSFLNACMTAEGRQWGEHHNIDELLALGLAAGKISYTLPRAMWISLPGGMPYFTIKS